MLLFCLILTLDEAVRGDGKVMYKSKSKILQNVEE
jgi:hypothetical protein